MKIATRGFSLIEIIFSMLLVAILAVLGLTLSRGGVAAADSHSLALTAAEALRVARQSAMANLEPVAVILPTNNGVTPTSQSLYTATGLSMAHVRSVNLYGGNSAQTVLFEGVWPVSSGSFSLYPSLADQRYAEPYNPFPFPKWLANPNLGAYSFASDYALIFQPDGSVISNGVPYYSDANAGAYYIVAAAGVAFQPTAAPAQGIVPPAGASALNYFQLSGAGKPWVIGVTPTGEIAVSSGLPGVDANAMQIFDSTIPVTGPLGKPPVVTVMPPSNPTAQVQLTPASGTSGLPPGVDTTIAPGQHLSLAVNATDTSGRDLYVQWFATPKPGNNANTAPVEGSFACSGPQKMYWDNLNQVWTVSWDWQCPPSSVQGDQWTFTCGFSDGVSAMVPYAPLTQQVLAVVQAHLWVIYVMPDTTYQLWKMNVDGTGAVLVAANMPAVPSGGLSVSADGQLVYLLNDWRTGFEVLSGNTGQVIQTVPGIQWVSAMSPRGDKIVTAGHTAPFFPPPTEGLWISDAAGGGSHQLWTGPNINPLPPPDPAGNGCCIGTWKNGSAIAWSPDETKVAVAVRWNGIVSPTTSVWVVDVATGVATPVLNSCPPPTQLVATGSMMWDPTSRYLFHDLSYAVGSVGGFFSSYSVPATDGELLQWDSVTQDYTANGKPYTNTGGAMSFGGPIRLSPDGTRFYFLNASNNALSWIASTPGASVINPVAIQVPAGATISAFVLSQ